MKKNLLLLTVIFMMVATLHSQVVIDDAFATSNTEWQSVNLSGTGNFNIANGKMNLSAANNSIFSAYNTNVLTGHFYIEVDFEQDDNVGLVLFNANPDGSPDTNNYSIIKVEEENGVPVVSITDRQSGFSNVLDNSGALSPTEKAIRYKNTLDGTTYSIPYTSTNKKLRIFRHANENFIHFSYAVKKTIDGVDATGWIELAPSKEWNDLSGNFLMGLVCTGGTATFDNAFATNKALHDQNDGSTGFAATWREMNWSGYFGDALVVTFDATDAPLTGGTRKFVFWEAFNNVPAWFLDDDVMYTYEFVETWGGGSNGPHEPMSDRLLRFSDITLDYDGNDYKIVHWQYALHDPDYKWPDFGQGVDKPVVDEYYKIYPDGTILRRIQYKAKLDTQFRNWHELTELIVISGNSTDPGDHLASPAISIWPINGQLTSYNPTGPGNDYEQYNNDATILATHMINHPDIVNVFSDNSSSHETYPGDPIAIYKTWHDRAFHMSHWPINKEQYYSDSFKSETTWSQQIKHAALAGAGVYHNNSDQWNNNFITDPNDGRKYREWISYMSLSNDLNTTKTNVEAWLNDPWNWGSTAVLDNLALNKPTTTSSIRGNFNLGAEAVDGNDQSRWESQHGSDIEWIYVDLQNNENIHTIVINWENSYSSTYRIDVSDDANNWTTVYSETTADGGLDVIELTNVNARYVRIYGLDRASQYGHSIYEIKVYGDSSLSVSEFDTTQTGITVYPNPVVDDNFTIATNVVTSSTFEAEIVSVSGKTVLRTSFNVHPNYRDASIDVSSLASDMYILKLTDKITNEKHFKKILISR